VQYRTLAKVSADGDESFKLQKMMAFFRELDLTFREISRFADFLAQRPGPDFPSFSVQARVEMLITAYLGPSTLGHSSGSRHTPRL
jgi:hypothetical protein